MAAAVGQTRLMSLYDRLFAQHKFHVGQVLLTHDGLKDRQRHLNARNTMLNLLRNGIVPVVNENDAVANDEIRFGDNDHLAVLVSILIDADALVLLTSADGLREPAGNGRTRRVKRVEAIDDRILALACGKTSELSSGGMASKLEAAGEAARNGVPVIMANGRKAHVLTRIFSGQDEGTLILPQPAKLSRRKRWIAFFNRVEGTLVVDDGAAAALREKGKSLLPVGIRRVEGTFRVGAMVRIQTADGHRLARGLTEYSSADLECIKGKTSREIIPLLGTDCFDEAVHRDNMVLLQTAD
jgi:glutamate 5-kinase